MEWIHDIKRQGLLRDHKVRGTIRMTEHGPVNTAEWVYQLDPKGLHIMGDNLEPLYVVCALGANDEPLMSVQWPSQPEAEVKFFQPGRMAPTDIFVIQEVAATLHVNPEMLKDRILAVAVTESLRDR